MLQRQGGTFTFDVEVKDEESQKQSPSSEWTRPKNPVKSSQSTKMEVDYAHANSYSALWDEGEIAEGAHEGMICNPCGMAFHRL